MSPSPYLIIAAALLVPQLAQAAESSATQDEAELGFSHYALSNNYASWDSLYLDGAHRFGQRHSIYGELRETRRFSLTDREISGGYYHPISESWTALVAASTSPEHHVLPQDSLFGQLQKAFDGGWDIQAGLRHTRYNLVSANLLVLTGERYWGNYRAAYTLYQGRLQGSGTAPSHLLLISRYYSDHSYFTLALSRGRQAESLGPGLGVLLLDVRGASLSGRHWLNSAWGLSYEAVTEQQGNLYTRRGVLLGLRYAF
ncbi:MAG TPA: YaiO family outer membrane beta-barrel protein [Gallionellaceae bacterium]